jgi:hypothetical protein
MTKLNWKAFASTTALMWGGYLFFAAILAALNITTLWFSPQTFNLVASIYPGISASFAGAVIGLLWGAACGAFCGGIFAGLYNWFSEKFE